MGAPPLLTVSMPARNSARFIGAAIASVLRETGVELELIVVDDGSEDDTVAVVESFDDPRLLLLRNPTRRGIGYCHNRVIEQASSPFIAHVDSDDIVVAGALPKLVAKLDSDARLGQVHCFEFDIDAEGEVTRDAFRERRRSLLALHRESMDYKRQFLMLGMVANHLRTYRREVFTVVGGFDETLQYGVDYHMSLRIVDRFDIAVVPELLYGHRIHDSNVAVGRPLASLRFWWQRFRLLWRFKHSGALRFLQQEDYPLGRLMIAGLGHILAIPRARFASKRWLTLRRGIRGILTEAFRPAAVGLYYWSVGRLSWWPLTWLRRAQPAAAPAGKRIAAYLWHFPALSETFIRRELAALAEQGYEVRIFADGPADLEFADDEAKALLPATEFLTPLDPELLATYRQYYWRNKPVQYVNAMFFVLFHRYAYWKTLSEDRIVFQRAVYLAGRLRDNHIGHLHSPWADRSAFVALVAARLAGVPCTIQARAHDLHRTLQRYAMREKFAQADGVITNCRYNETFIRSGMPEFAAVNLHTIYEGIDLAKFRPNQSWRVSPPLRILCVARLIEEKGLEYLLEACARLKRANTVFQCDIIGGGEVPRYADYQLGIKKLHRKLSLQDCVHFRGAQPFRAVLDAYQEADLFVLPCVVASSGGRDITPNALIEAMAMQLPVVSTQLSGIPEIVEHGVSGLLVPPNDADALCAAIETLAMDAGLRESLGRNARLRIEDRFDLKKNSRQFAQVLGSMAS